MKKAIILFFLVIAATLLLFTGAPKVTHASISFSVPSPNGIVPCGRSSGTAEETAPCQPCHLAILFQRLVQFCIYLATLLAVFSMMIAAGMFIFSGIDNRLIVKAKNLSRVSIKGFLITLGAYLFVNLILLVSGSSVKLQDWGNFQCNVPEILPSPVPQTKKLLALDVECEMGHTDTLALATEATKDNPSTYTLKAVATFEYTDENGQKTQGTEDVTQKVTGSAVDQTVARTNKTTIQAVGSGDTSVQVSYSEGAETQTKSVNVFVNSCPKDAGSGASGSCAVCGQAKPSTCELVSGNANAQFIYIIGRSDSDSSNDNDCVGELWNKNDPSQLEHFKNLVNKMSQELNILSSIDPSMQSQFAMYRSDKIYTKDEIQNNSAIKNACQNSISNFQNVKVVMSGFLLNVVDSHGKTYAYTLNVTRDYPTFYCSYKDDEIDVLFAHEQIGHQFGTLDDEYTTQKDAPGLVKNCTADSKGSKWKYLGGGSFKGCTIAGAYRSTLESIMNPIGNQSSFSPVQKAIIKSVFKTFPNTTTKFDKYINKLPK